LTLANWDYGLRKRYFFGLSRSRNSERFENNPEFNRLAKIDKQIGDSLSNLAHVEYDVVLPVNYSIDKIYPILFVFHGNNWNLEISKNVWASKIVKEKFITVYIQSYIYMSHDTYQWKLNDEKTNREFKQIFEQIIKKYSVNKDNVVFTGMSAGGMLATDYTFNQFVPVNGLVLNCPVIPNVSDSLISKFVNENKKIAIITGENDWGLNNQKGLINKIGKLGGNNRIKINAGMGHEVAEDFSTSLDEFLNWILE
jgi:predicted esterase